LLKKYQPMGMPRLRQDPECLKSAFSKGGFRQQSPVRKLPAGVLSPLTPTLSPQQLGGEGAGYVFGLQTPKALNRVALKKVTFEIIAFAINSLPLEFLKSP
jgi:hypothetical protein